MKSEKIYYTVHDIAQLLGESDSLIRFWNTAFESLIKPKRNNRGVRFFTADDVETYQKIHHLVKERGYTLSGALEALKASKTENDENFEVIKTLKTIRQFLLELKEQI